MSTPYQLPMLFSAALPASPTASPEHAAVQPTLGTSGLQCFDWFASCVLVENVRGGISSGLLDEIGGDLESAGYQVLPLVYPAQFVGAPHLRYRLFLLAYRQSPRLEARGAPAPTGSLAGSGAGGLLGDPAGNGQSHEQKIQSGVRRTGLAVRSTVYQQRKLPQPGLVRAADGLPAGLDFPGFPAYFGQAQHDYEPPRTVIRPGEHHRPRIQALGNAVVPKHAEPLFITLARWLTTAP